MLAAEDREFFTMVASIPRPCAGRHPEFHACRPGPRQIGASTITQQVAKNMLLGNEYSFARKIKEAILAVRMEQRCRRTHP